MLERLERGAVRFAVRRDRLHIAGRLPRHTVTGVGSAAFSAFIGAPHLPQNLADGLQPFPHLGHGILRDRLFKLF